MKETFQKGSQKALEFINFIEVMLLLKENSAMA
jgi:hypothetical protein